MDDSIRDSERLTIERHRHQHRNIRKKPYGGTEEGVAVTGDLLLQPLIDFLKDPDNPFRPPSELEERLHRIPDHHPHVALAILAPVLDGFARDREDNEQARILNRNGVLVSKRHSRTPLAEDLGTHLLGWLVHKEREMAEAERARRYKELTGKRLSPRKGRPSRRRFNHSDWTASECVVAGDWMLRIALKGRWVSPPCFGEDEDGHIYITPEWQDKIDKICDDVLWHHPVMLPHRKPPPDWTEWWKHYGDRLRAKFIRSCHPDTKKAIEDNFAVAARPLDVSGPLAELHYSIPFAHADGLNALKNVPLRINQDLVPLVDEFAVKLMGHIGDKRTADRKTVKADLVHIRWCDKDPIHLDYNCDDRGRVYPIQRLHFAREDHVRGIFEFARGAPLSADGVSGRDARHWLEIHAANCYAEGKIDKKPWPERLRWTNDNKNRIERVAADPQNNFDLWKDADNPFAFVAACMELSRARKNPTDFETHLPIPFDGSCNAIQHLAMLSRDAEVGRLVNLTNTDKPLDVYSVVITHILEMLEIGDKRLGEGPRAVEHFKWWDHRLSELDKDPERNEKLRRKLLKTAVMTFTYGSTVRGMRDDIVKTHADLLPNRTWPTDEAATFLARAVRLACKDKLLGPTRIMEYIHDLARYRLKQKHDKFLKLRGPTGFPFANICYETNIVDIDLKYGGIRSRYTVADGDLPEIDESGVITQSVPNFVHFLDATHLIFTVLAANSERIHDIIPVHDSYACLAPYAKRFGQIIRAQMAVLYHRFDPLRALRDANVDDPNILPLPFPVCPEIVPLLNPLDVQNAEYAFM